MLGFPVVMYVNPINNINWFKLQRVRILLGGLSDCEELVGVTHRGGMGVSLKFENYKF